MLTEDWTSFQREGIKYQRWYDFLSERTLGKSKFFINQCFSLFLREMYKHRFHVKKTYRWLNNIIWTWHSDLLKKKHVISILILYAISV